MNSPQRCAVAGEMEQAMEMSLFAGTAVFSLRDPACPYYGQTCWVHPLPAIAVIIRG
jgi:hypothetical protein